MWNDFTLNLQKECSPAKNCDFRILAFRTEEILSVVVSYQICGNLLQQLQESSVHRRPHARAETHHPSHAWYSWVQGKALSTTRIIPILSLPCLKWNTVETNGWGIDYYWLFSLFAVRLIHIILLLKEGAWLTFLLVYHLSFFHNWHGHALLDHSVWCPYIKKRSDKLEEINEKTNTKS